MLSADQKSRRVLFVMTQPCDRYSGGIQMSTWKIGSWLADAGQDVSIFSFVHEGHEAPGFAKFFHPIESGGYGNTRNLGFLIDTVEKLRPDVIINQTPYDLAIAEALQPYRRSSAPQMLACLRNSLFSVKLNIDDYRRSLLPGSLATMASNALGEWALQALHRRRHRSQLRAILEKHDKFILFGPPNHDEIEYFIGNDCKDQLPCIPNSIPNVAEELPKKNKILLYVGRLATHQKRAELLLPLWARMHQELPGWEFHIVGEGSYRAAMERVARNERLPRVVFHGKQDPYAHYQRSALTVMTSSFEGFPNVTIEAQSRGAVPVLMNSFPLASWVVNHERDAILVPPFDLDQMAGCIRDLALNDDLRERMQRQALINACRFHIDTVGKLWLKLFQGGTE